MDAELLELQRQFETAQNVKSSVRLSERNVVELVRKLQDLNFIEFDLLHTVSGKEYITPDQLRTEMLVEINKSGRISLIDLSDVIGVDLYHIEKQADQILNDDLGMMLVQGEIMSQFYWNTIAEEINEKLQECSQIAIAELAAQLQVASELILSILEPRLGTTVKGRLEGGQLYTPAYVTRINAMVCGAVRGITVPSNLSTVWNSLQHLLQELNGTNSVSVESSMFQSQFISLVKEGKVLGSARAGIQWTPTVFAHAQTESVDSFFSQNSFITYDILHKLAIPHPKQYLQSRYPDGIPLDNAFIHQSTAEMLDVAIEDAIENGNWIDSLSVLPSYIASEDIAKILPHCPTLQMTLKSSKAVVFGESCIFSTKFIIEMFNKLEKELETLSRTFLTSQLKCSDLHPPKNHAVGDEAGEFYESKIAGGDGGSGKNHPQKSSKKKKGKTSGSGKAAIAETDPDIQENISSKTKRNKRKGKDMGSVDISEPKSGAKKGSSKEKEGTLNIPSEEWVLQHILSLFPDLEGLGGSKDLHEVPKYLAYHLRPMLMNSWKRKRDSILVESADQRRQLLESLQKYLDEAFLNFQLYAKALDIFEDEPSLLNVLHKHLLRTFATSIVDRLILNLDTDNKLMNGIEVEDPSFAEQKTLSSADRVSMAKGLSGSLSIKAQMVVDSLEDKKVDTFINSLRGVAEERGLALKKLDKKTERTLLHLYRKDLTSQVSSETDPVAFLPRVVGLLYLQVYNRALQAPGRSISAALCRLKDKMVDSTFEILTDYHSATVSLLALLSASTENEEDCTSDRILSKREFLEMKMAELKDLILKTADS